MTPIDYAEQWVTFQRQRRQDADRAISQARIIGQQDKDALIRALTDAVKSSGEHELMLIRTMASMAMEIKHLRASNT